MERVVVPLNYEGARGTDDLAVALGDELSVGKRAAAAFELLERESRSARMGLALQRTDRGIVDEARRPDLGRAGSGDRLGAQRDVPAQRAARALSLKAPADPAHPPPSP